MVNEVAAGGSQPLAAPSAWRCIDFISDLHLHADQPATFAAWQHYMGHTAAQAVFILGDLFEAWVGDDAIGAIAAESSATDSFEDRCAQVLKRSAAQRDVFFMCGNRDFLVGEKFTRACAVQWLPDPTTLAFAGRRWLLSHGDALCLADTDYLQFRALVRSAPWQRDFLAQPLEQRKALARSLRARSEAHKRSHPVLADVDTDAAVSWLKTAACTTLIHGHTHRPADHHLGHNLQRIVLSDWDLETQPPRAQVLRISWPVHPAPTRIERLALDAA